MRINFGHARGRKVSDFNKRQVSILKSRRRWRLPGGSDNCRRLGAIMSGTCIESCCESTCCSSRDIQQMTKQCGLPRRA